MKARTILGSIALSAAAVCVPAAAVPAVATAAATAASASTPAVHIHGNLHIVRNARIPQTHLPRLTKAGLSNTVYDSTNWAGYAAVAAKGVKLTAVQAEFTVPSINCATAPSGAAEAEWAGLDGGTSASKTVEQEGILAYCDTSTSAPAYYAWYEIYPAAAVAFTGTINPGDEIVVGTGKYKTGTNYQVSLTDVTSNDGFSTEVACPSGSTCSASTAEAIVEAPYNGTVGAQSPLADYGFINFVASQLAVNYAVKANFSGSSKSYSLRQINMVNSSNAPLSTTTLLLGGRDFTDTWNASS